MAHGTRRLLGLILLLAACLGGACDRQGGQLAGSLASTVDREYTCAYANAQLGNTETSRNHQMRMLRVLAEEYCPDSVNAYLACLDGARQGMAATECARPQSLPDLERLGCSKEMKARLAGLTDGQGMQRLNAYVRRSDGLRPAFEEFLADHCRQTTLGGFSQ